jgi:hypothetical protein
MFHPVLPFLSAAIACAARVKILTVLPATLAALAVLFPLALRPAPVEVTPEQATAAFKSVIAASIKSLRSELTTAKQAFLFDISAYETGAQQGLDIVTHTSNFFSECAAFQKSVQDATNVAMGEIIEGAVDNLDALSNGLPLDGVYPKDFYSGSGGALDKARRDVKLNVERLYKSVANRLRKTATLLGKEGVALTIELRPPRYLDDHRFTEDLSSVFINRFGVDFVLAINRPNLLEDGRVWIGGAAYSSVDDVTVSVSGTESDSATVPTSSGRWAVHLTDGGTNFLKGNYTANIEAEIDVAGTGVAFSFR